MKPFVQNCSEYKIYTFDKSYFLILQKIVLGDYCQEKQFQSNYNSAVELISIEGQSYILKRIFFKRFRKKLLTFFRKSDCLKILLNTQKLQNMGLSELVSIYGAGVLKKHLVQDQFILMPYIEGRILQANESEKVQEFLLRLHRLKHCHGDVAPPNFMYDQENNLVAIDTRLKKMLLGNIQAHRDMIIFQKKFATNKIYPYEKNIFYYYCQWKEKLTKRL